MSTSDEPVVPGEVLVATDPVRANEGRPVIELVVVNRGDRPVQVGSHFHVAEANPALELDRVEARGMHLDIPAGTSVRFEPGLTTVVRLVPYVGARVVAGFRGEVGGPLDA